MSLLNGTMTPIQTVTVGAGGTSSITFSNIPQTYTDLQVVHSLRDTSNTGNYYIDVYWTVNGQTSASGKVIYTINGSTAGSYSPTNIAVSENSSLSTASTFSNNFLYISNYTSTGVKSISGEIIIEQNATASVVAFGAFTVTNGAAITSLTVTAYGNFAQHSTATLYGISKYTGETGGKAIGGVVTSDANYWYHTFTNSGMFTPTQSLTADYLLIGGGGAGGNSHGPGGGGAGGHQYLTAQSLTAQSYPVLIGAGGGISDSNTVQGNPGSPSKFNGTTAGGGGGGREYLVGTGGASGSPQSLSGGSGAVSSYSERGGGGGGTSSAGTNATSTTGGNGGNGTANSITGTSVTRAGGGAGGGARDTASGSAGSGGGGAGGTGGGVPASPGAQYTGSGGGGGRDGIGGNGGSGILIIRYAK